MRTWSAIKFEVASPDEDLACWVAIQAGAQGCEVSPGEHADLAIKAYFEPDTTTSHELALKLEEFGLSEALKTLAEETVQEEDWLTKWKAGFHSFDVGKKLRIQPIWEGDTPPKRTEHGRITILLDPGMAFGTGLHATTQYCLERIEERTNFGRVADVGTGSGILSIAAALIDGQCEIHGVDTSENSIINAGRNLELNGVQNRIKPIEGSTDRLSGQFDTIFSNLTCEDIVALLPDYMRIAKPGCEIICAGILAEKEPLMLAEASKNNLRVTHKEERKGWLGMVLKT